MATCSTESKYVGEDVFLSHSGKQKNFVRQLHRDLTIEGVSCFFDESRQSLPLGEKWPRLIFEAANTCRIAVLLLSMDFIRSKWPMLELSAFLKAKKSGINSNLKILPLFYKISPDDLKDLTLDTQDIPDQTRPEISEKNQIEWKDISEETRIEWKEALREVRQFNGLRFEEGGNEVSFRDEIRKEIWNLLPPSGSVGLAQPTYPARAVGLAGPQDKVIELLELKSKDTRLLTVVINGFGGIGKTTLAEAVVATIDLKHYSYSRVDLDEDFSTKRIIKMQEKILNEAFPEYTKRIRTKIITCSDGRARLTKAFENEGIKPVFLFIDNALREKDLRELLPGDLRGLPQGSRILVTSRDLGATDMLTEYEAGLKRRAHLVNPLPPEEAKDFLLQGCANRQFKDIEEDVKEIVKICKGVPLVLKIVRGHFRKQGNIAEKCSQIIGALEGGTDVKEEDLSKCLTDFVYGKFEESTQQAFLDICCFFRDWNPDQVECIVGAQELTSLEEAAFVQRSEKELIVHDIIRERGRNKSKPTRIMDVESLTHAVANEQGLEHIRGVRLVNEDESEYVLEEQHMKAMRKLRVLALGDGIRVSGRSHLTFEELRFFRGGGHISLRLNLNRLPRLTFYESPFKEYKESMWIAAVQSCCLNWIDFKDTQKLPDGLHHLIELKMLTLNGWHKMVELSENVCQLRLLKYLCLEGWTSLQCLPESIGQLKGLKHFSLSGCASLPYLPESLCGLSALKHLDLAHCSNLKSLPESFGRLTSLTKLSLYDCNSLKGFPSTFVHLTALKFVNVSFCPAAAKLQKINAGFKALVMRSSNVEKLRVALLVRKAALQFIDAEQHPNCYKISQVSICRLCN